MSTNFQEMFEAERSRADALEAELAEMRRAIQDRDAAESALRQQWRTFDTALSNTPDFTYIFDLDGRFTYINRALLALWQRSLEESVGKNFFDLEYPQDLAERLQRQIQEVIDTKGIVRDQTPYTGADGSEGYYEYIFVPVLDRDGAVVAVTGSTRNITHRKRIEDVIRESQERLKQIFEQAPVPIVVFNGPDFVVELANPHYHDLLQGREIVGRKFADIMPELGEHVWSALRGVMDTGKPFLASEWLVPFDQNRDGLIEDVWFNLVYHPIHDLNGAVTGIIAVANDVSAQVKARKTLERANRGLEEFAFAASHDLQEPLRTVNIYSELLLKHLGQKDADELNRYADFVKTGVSRMGILIRDLLDYSTTVQRDENNDASDRANLNDALAQALSGVEASITENDAEVICAPLPVVAGNTGQFAHVFQNLLANGLKYRKPDVRPCIRIAAEEKAGNWEISVRDNGIGFDPDQAERIFGLFKRLHGHTEYPGSGLGLAISRRIVERYGGRIWAESEEGNGATFYFSLPSIKEVRSE